MRFVMMSDTHYLSREMIADKNDKEALLQPAVTEQALMQAAEEADTIIISGDLTDDGDRPSHEEFVKLLRGLKEKGKNVYVIFATHDFHHHRAWVRRRGDTKVKFRSAPWELPYFDPENVNWKDYVTDEYKNYSEEECTPQLVASCTPEEIWEMYREFGPDQAISQDAGSFSYCVELDENTRCLMLNDIFRNEEGQKDKSPTYTPSCLRWMKKEIDRAKADGKFIFVCSHHPFIPCTPLHRIGTDNRNLRSPVPGHILADMGIDLAFTGHTHVSSLRFLCSAAGNTLCHVSTPAVRFYPPAYRVVELDGLNGKLSYECIDVKIPDGAELQENTLREHYYYEMYKEYYRKAISVKPPFDKIVMHGTLKELVCLFGRKAKLTKAERERLKDIKLYDYLTDVIFNMLTGDGKFTPDTPEYRLLMSVAVFADSIIDAQPFTDIRNKILKGYKAAEIVGELMFKNGISDNKADFDFTVMPEKTTDVPDMTSHAGDIFTALVYIAAVPLSFLAPAAVAAGIPVKYLLKKAELKKNPPKPLDKYF